MKPSIKPSDEHLRGLVQRAKVELSKPVQHNAYLHYVAQCEPSHRFLGNSTGLIYGRQVSFLNALLTMRFKRPAPSIRVLDWGCGKGHISYLLRQAGFDVTSCDRDSGLDDSAFAQRTPIIEENGIDDVVSLKDDVALPFQSASFDCFVSFGVLEHVQNDAASLKELRRVLRPDGIGFICFLPYTTSWTQALSHLRGNRYHDRLYTKRSLGALSGQADLRLLDAWHAQLFPKNSIPASMDRILEPADQWLCRRTPLRYFATNIEAVLLAGA